jgi:hypothetical protein
MVTFLRSSLARTAAADGIREGRLPYTPLAAKPGLFRKAAIGYR